MPELLEFEELLELEELFEVEETLKLEELLEFAELLELEELLEAGKLLKLEDETGSVALPPQATRVEAMAPISSVIVVFIECTSVAGRRLDTSE